jgi:GntR family transcriptional regulator / MocR family aminotransferase
VRSVAVEDPSYPGLAVNLRSLGLDIVHVPVDHDGINVAMLERSNAQAVVLAPAHQFPTGASLSQQRRMQLLAWAQCRQAWVVEDDYDAEFRYDQEPMPALQGQVPERVIYIGTASKILSPALRLGWMLTPGVLTAPMALMKRRIDRGGPAIEQIALARLLESGAVDRHLRTARVAYRRRREALLQALSHVHPAARTRGAAAGLHVMVELPVDVDEALVVREARECAIRVFGGSAYRREGSAGAAALVLGFGGIAESKIAEGVSKLADIIARCRGSDVRKPDPSLQRTALAACG